jgi:hypothetical protein
MRPPLGSVSWPRSRSRSSSSRVSVRFAARNTFRNRPCLRGLSSKISSRSKPAVIRNSPGPISTCKLSTTYKRSGTSFRKLPLGKIRHSGASRRSSSRFWCSTLVAQWLSIWPGVDCHHNGKRLHIKSGSGFAARQCAAAGVPGPAHAIATGTSDTSAANQ